jgi:hypothetical protein
VYPEGDALLKMPTTGIVSCCARAASGHVTAAPPTRPRNSRRLMGRPFGPTSVNYHTAGTAGLPSGGVPSTAAQRPLRSTASFLGALADVGFRGVKPTSGL